MDRLHALTDGFAGLRVLVLGDAMLDCYLHGTAERLCPEAPVPVVDVRESDTVPGGAANTARNIAALGGHASLLSLRCDDGDGEELFGRLEAAGVDTSLSVRAPGRRTQAKRRVMSRSQVLLRLDEGDGIAADAETNARVIRTLRSAFREHDAVIVSDYGYGTVSPETVAALASAQRRAPRVLVADSKHLTAYRRAGVTAVKPNYDGAIRLLGDDPSLESGARASSMAERGEQILALTGARIAAVTLDTEGAIVFERERSPYRTYARPVVSSSTSGAGDTYTAALTMALAAGAETPEAAELAQAAAAVVVAQPGTSTCSVDELRASLGGSEKMASDGIEAAARLRTVRSEGRRIVFTNGCFDILHRGHVTYLSQAKSLGDILVVGVNSDESVRRLKGESRPVNPLRDRMQLLDALSCVDLVVPFTEDTPHNLIEAIRPDVFAKGGDYTVERLPEAKLVASLGGEVRLLPYLPDRSTSGLIDRILGESRTAEGE